MRRSSISQISTTPALGPGRKVGGQHGGTARLARWGLAIAVCGGVLFTSADPESLLLRQMFAGVVIAVNILATILLHRSPTGMGRFALPIVDIALVTGAVWLAEGAQTDFFLVYFLALILAAFASSVAAAGLYSVGVGLIYGALLYADLGSALFTSNEFLLRIGVVCVMGFLFGLLADSSKGLESRAKAMESQVLSVAQHAKTLARDKYRLRALSEIGRLGLVGSASSADTELLDISRRVQKGVGVDRCSLVIFNADGSTGFVAASSDDDRVEVRTLDIDDYPELQATLVHGQITQVRPNEPQELWDLMCQFLPEANTFASFLVVPIKAESSIFGAFYLRDRSADRVFDEEEQDFCWAAAMMTASFIRGRDLLDQLTRQSRVDGLTGLLNYQAFTEELHAVLGHPQADTYAPFTIVMVDMDNLKPINDQYGHNSGNLAITMLGERLQAALPNAIAMCRYGGDEFVVLVHGALEGTVVQVEQMLNGLTTMAWNEPFDLRASVGVSEYPKDGRTPEALLEAADQAMYLAKGSGGHRVRAADATTTDDEIYDAVVQVQTRRIAPDVAERFEQNLSELERHVTSGLQSPMVKQSVAALMEAVESLDPHTEAHSKLVSQLCRGLAEKLQFPPREVLKAEIGGYLHDVGKMKLPPEILTKKGPLTDEERAVVQQGPVLGAQILDALPGLREVAELVYTYQERWDGSGYPSGISGDEIPPSAQIIGICDVYQALVSPRAQRPALDEERAQRLIEQEIGRLWNPAVARVFLEMLAKRAPASSASEQSAPGGPNLRAAEG